MKLMKLPTLVVLLLAATIHSAFAVGKMLADDVAKGKIACAGSPGLLVKTPSPIIQAANSEDAGNESEGSSAANAVKGL